MSILAEILNYADRGWLVFPIKPRSKHPAIAGGFKAGTTNPATIQRWFGHYPYNIGIRTGLASGICVVDTDGVAGKVSLHDLQSQHGQLPVTLTTITPNGKHFWFSIDVPMPSSNDPKRTWGQVSFEAG